MLVESLSAGFDLFFTPLTLGLTLAGLLFGLLVGALPGLGPLMGIILMLPVVIGQQPIAAMGFLIAIFVGGSCGGSISAILLRIPGTPLAAATLFDGYPMAQKGRAADAIGIAITASSLGGPFGGFVLIFLAPLLAEFASGFAPPELYVTCCDRPDGHRRHFGWVFGQGPSGWLIWSAPSDHRNGRVFDWVSLHLWDPSYAERLSHRGGRCRLVRGLRDGVSDHGKETDRETRHTHGTRKFFCSWSDA